MSLRRHNTIVKFLLVSIECGIFLIDSPQQATLERAASLHCGVQPAMVGVIPEAHFLMVTGHEDCVKAPSERGGPFASSIWLACHDVDWRERLSLTACPTSSKPAIAHVGKRNTSPWVHQRLRHGFLSCWTGCGALIPVSNYVARGRKCLLSEGLYLPQQDVALLRDPVPPGAPFLRACRRSLLRCDAVAGSSWDVSQ